MYCKINCKIIVVLILVGFAGVSFAAPQQSGSYSTADDGAWAEDMSKKIDKSIEVMDVIKQELKEYQQEQAKYEKTKYDTSEDAEAANMKNKVSTAVRIWRKIRNLTARGADKVADLRAKKQEEEAIKQIKSNLDKTMQIMQVIREELNEAEKESSK